MGWHLDLSAEIIYKLYLLKEVKKKKSEKPLERIELSTPGSLDQCSNNWATEPCDGHLGCWLGVIHILNKNMKIKKLTASGENWILDPWFYKTSALTTELQRAVVDIFYLSAEIIYKLKPIEESRVKKKKKKAPGENWTLDLGFYKTSALTTELQRLWFDIWIFQLKSFTNCTYWKK